MDKTTYHAARRTYRAARHADRLAAAKAHKGYVYTALNSLGPAMPAQTADAFLRSLEPVVQAAITARPSDYAKGRIRGPKAAAFCAAFPAYGRHAGLNLFKRVAVRRALAQSQALTLSIAAEKEAARHV